MLHCVLRSEKFLIFSLLEHMSLTLDQIENNMDRPRPGIGKNQPRITNYPQQRQNLNMQQIPQKHDQYLPWRLIEDGCQSWLSKVHQWSHQRCWLEITRHDHQILA